MLHSMDSQLAYQSAFLQNAVAQNMQIQQQLMLQNQVRNYSHSNVPMPNLHAFGWL